MDYTKNNNSSKKDSWFSHVVSKVQDENTRNEWCEAVTDEECNKLN